MTRTTSTDLPLANRDILVADDDLARIFADALRARGATAAEARDGREALDLLAERRFDIVVLNYRMPRLNGAEVLSAMRESGDATPVVFVSASSRDEIPERLDGLAFDDWIEKPITMHRLAERIATVLNRHQSPIPPTGAAR